MHLKLSRYWLCIPKDELLCELVCVRVTVCVFPQGISVRCGEYS